jgi:hypothetical protein
LIDDYIPVSDLPDLKSWQPRPRQAKTTVEVPCRVVSIGKKGHEAVCSMVMGGREVPRVSFPAEVLRAKGLKAGSRFLWRMSTSGEVCSVDIITDVPADPSIATPEDLHRLETLYEEMKERNAKDGPWPIYTGDGK